MNKKMTTAMYKILKIAEFVVADNYQGQFYPQKPIVFQNNTTLSTLDFKIHTIIYFINDLIIICGMKV